MGGPIFYKPKKSKWIWSILVSVAVMAAVLCGVYYANLFLERGEINTYIASAPTLLEMDVSLESGISYGHSVNDNRLIFYSSENIKFINVKGELEENVSLNISNPMASVAGNYTLLFDQNGKIAYLFQGARTVKTYTLEESIISAKVNTSGNSVFITKGDTHKCSVWVLNSRGEELFKYNSGGLHILDADLSGNNKDITISTINTDEGIIKSNILMFHNTKTNAFTNDQYEDMLFSIIKYSDGNIYCIGDSMTLIYNGYGKVVGKIHYDDRELLTYDLDGGILILGFAGSDVGINGKGSVIESYNSKGENIGKYNIDQGIEFLDSKDGDIAVNNGRTVAILNSRCKEKFQMNLGMEIKDFLYISGSGKAVGITGTGAYLIEVKR